MNSLSFCDPDTRFRGEIVVVSPHMNDGELACGGTVLRITDKSRVHFVYVADGRQVRYSLARFLRTDGERLSKIRIREAQRALEALGVPQPNVTFLNYEAGNLGNHTDAIAASLQEVFKQIEPSHVFFPFRYDRHPDHLAVHRATRSALEKQKSNVDALEYFIYYRSRLLARRDIRCYISPEYLIAVDICDESRGKKAALECYRSQVTAMYPWQSQPVLSDKLLNEFSSEPEVFLMSDDAPDGAMIFERARFWIRVVDAIEPVLKILKHRLLSLVHRINKPDSKP